MPSFPLPLPPPLHSAPRMEGEGDLEPTAFEATAPGWQRMVMGIYRMSGILSDYNGVRPPRIITSVFFFTRHANGRVRTQNVNFPTYNRDAIEQTVRSVQASAVVAYMSAKIDNVVHLVLQMITAGWNATYVVPQASIALRATNDPVWTRRNAVRILGPENIAV